MKYLIGDIGNTSTKICILNNKFKILKTYKHPNADRLKICEINYGQETYKVVCGASNAIEGLKTTES